MSDTTTPHSRAWEACNLLKQVHGEMQFLTVAIAEAMGDRDLSNGANTIMARITDDLERLNDEFWDLLQFIPKPEVEQPRPRPPLTPEEIAIKAQVEALADRLKAIQEERQALTQEEPTHG